MTATMRREELEEIMRQIESEIDAMTREVAFTYLRDHFADHFTEADVIVLHGILVTMWTSGAETALEACGRKGEAAASPQPFGAPVRCRSCGGIP